MVDHAAEFLADLRRLTKLSCVRTGISVGSLSTVDFGRLMRRAEQGQPSRAPHGRMTAAFVLYMLCPWKITQARRQVCSWEDDRPKMEAALALLPGRKVIGVGVVGPYSGIEIGFGDEVVLHVLPEKGDHMDEYEFSTPEWRYTTFADGRIAKEPREQLVEVLDIG